MGTNYYLHKEPACESCGREHEPLHIGKSSLGWCFSLHVIPEKGINTLEDWRELWKSGTAYILDEYDERVPIEEMEKIITQRSHPIGLYRHPLDGRHCLGHGDGTWDYIAGEFS